MSLFTEEEARIVREGCLKNLTIIKEGHCTAEEIEVAYLMLRAWIENASE